MPSNLHSAQTLGDFVRESVECYFKSLDGQPTSNLYEMVLGEIERPLLAAVLSFTHNNQTEAARILGLSRGTLRKKMQQYALDIQLDSTET
jgi:Fis family transcriptional regulator